MHLLLAPDKYKGSLDALGVVAAMRTGIELTGAAHRITALPLADGGDGFEVILRHHLGGDEVTCQVHDPLMRPIEAGYTLSADGQTAVIELARASGLALLTEAERDPQQTTTFGTGELIADALQRGVRRLLIGIGGSATHDGGMGLAAALGVTLLDANGEVVPPVGRNLARVARYRLPDPLPWQGVSVEVACDVTNPLLGPEGAAAVYAPQKGADAAAVQALEAGLRQLDMVWQQQVGRSLVEVPGAGAAGGVGAGLMAWLDAQLGSGIELVMREAGFEAALAGADLVLTGEGRLDGQTLAGKVIQGVCERAAQWGVPVAALCGAIDLTPAQQRDLGLTHAQAITPGPMPLDQALAGAHHHLVQATFSLVNLVTRLKPD